jgi:hypothetical protein
MSTPYRLAMRQLRFVGPGDDGEHVIVETIDGAEQFSLLINDAIRSGLHPEVAPASTRVAPEPASPIRPREIQVRVRSGEAPDALAAEAGISLDRVLLFAAPVLEERNRMAGEARRARARRSTPDGQLVNFGETVDERFSAHGIDPMAVAWDSHRRDDGQWIVSAGWRGGDSDRRAEWAFSLSARAVTPLDETASDLLSDRPIRPIVTAVPDLPTADRATPDAHTAPLPRTIDLPAAGDEDVFDQAATTDDIPLPLQLVDTPAKPAAGPAKRRGEPRDDETDEQRAARARIPSWDDILLGVRRKRD